MTVVKLYTEKYGKEIYTIYQKYFFSEYDMIGRKILNYMTIIEKYRYFYIDVIYKITVLS